MMFILKIQTGCLFFNDDICWSTKLDSRCFHGPPVKRPYCYHQTVFTMVYFKKKFPECNRHMSIVSMLTWISPILGTEQMRWRWRGGLTNGLSNILVLQMLFLQVCYGSWITTFLKTSEGTFNSGGKLTIGLIRVKCSFEKFFCLPLH